ncbi:MAG: ribosome recycling factor [Candidatus Tokpelaia sp. JSC188]|nr:MAG: ribosome recycling factor [Candidatus Tokpelaia sp. JSC188]
MSDAVKLDDLKRRMNDVIAAFRHELGSLRTGRASVNLLDPIMVEAYGSVIPINQVSYVSVLEPRMLSISVWNKSMVSAVERAIRASGLGLNPITSGTILRIPLPELNEEHRCDLVKVSHQYAEQARITLRSVRRDGMNDLKKAEKNNSISQDEGRRLSDKVQKLTDDSIVEVNKILTSKEAEIMQI